MKDMKELNTSQFSVHLLERYQFNRGKQNYEIFRLKKSKTQVTTEVVYENTSWMHAASVATVICKPVQFETIKLNARVKCKTKDNLMVCNFYSAAQNIAKISKCVSGRPFDSKVCVCVGGGLALFGNKQSDLENKKWICPLLERK